MPKEYGIKSNYGLQELGLKNISNIFWNLQTPSLWEQALIRGEGLLAENGPLVVNTGQYTGRSPSDKFVVQEANSEKNIWWGKVNVPIEEEKFNLIYNRMMAYLQGRDIFIQDCYAGADPSFQIPIRIITQYAWQSGFCRNMFPTVKQL